MSEWDDRRGDEETKHDLCPCHNCTAHRQQLTESNRQLREELEKVKILALRIYPDLKASGICSAHRDDGHFECETCYGNWKELAKAHCELKQKAWTSLAAAKEALQRISTQFPISDNEQSLARHKCDQARDALARIAECEKETSN